MRTRSIEVLLVEDRPADVQLMREALAVANARFQLRVVQLRVADSAAAALDYVLQRGASAQATRPDLVLLNYGVSGNAGAEVLRELKLCPPTRCIPVILLAATTDD